MQVHEIGSLRRADQEIVPSTEQAALVDWI
jgi:hypothetical protein